MRAFLRKVSQIPQLGERKKRLSFVPRPSAIRNDGEGEKKKSEWGQVLKLGRGWWWLVILAGVGKKKEGMRGSWNVLECLEQSRIIEWIWNKKRQTQVPQWKNVLLGRLKKHSIHSDSFTGPRTFLRWHRREFNPTSPPPPMHHSFYTYIFNSDLPFKSFFPYISYNKLLFLYIYSLSLWVMCAVFVSSLPRWKQIHVSRISSSRMKVCTRFLHFEMYFDPSWNGVGIK